MNLCRTSRALAASVALASVAACASAPPTRAFAELPGRIELGKRVGVTTKDGEVITGKVAGIHAQGLALVAGDTRREFPAHSIERVTRKKRHVVTGALIGLGVGAVAGVLGASSSESSGMIVDAMAAGYSVAGGLLLGTAAGAVIGALVQTDRTVYLAPTRP